MRVTLLCLKVTIMLDILDRDIVCVDRVGRRGKQAI
jgi:hypothetical protein